MNSKLNDKKAVINSERKLQDLVFVDYVSNLSDEKKALIVNSKVVRAHKLRLVVWFLMRHNQLMDAVA